ncbi:hypothetical protein HPB47_013464 [Ixodes persulcatus]|uniref:Uncharacterized protein n=1 Tax=Ixodes persulcatus TaxID=34615 RepID=A0AC60R154_IXOPE|nr:hypothetical protein HPB47_013464 [Ixodes persulcatus]
MATRQPFPDLTLEDYDPAPSKELICVICRSVLREPVECPCRHVFCKSCISTWLEESSNCPVCRIPAATFVSTLPLLRNMISQLTVKCRNTGCSTRVAAENYPAHMAVCKFQKVPCPHDPCEHHCLRRDIDDHVRTCSFRLVTCSPGCGVVLFAGQQTAHICIPRLERELEEMTAERDNWRRKAENYALGALQNCVIGHGATVEGLTNNVEDSCPRGTSAEVMTVTGGGLQPSIGPPSPGVSGSLSQEMRCGSRTARRLQEVDSDTDSGWDSSLSTCWS